MEVRAMASSDTGANDTKVESTNSRKSRKLDKPKIVNALKLITLAAFVAVAAITFAKPVASAIAELLFDRQIDENASRLLDEGKAAFRSDTFGDEAFWGDQLKLHQAIAGAENGGVGAGISPNQALGLGLKVDVDALPRGLVRQIQRGQVDLDDPAVTLALLRFDAVVGTKGFFDEDGNIESIGITCALCHSTVDDSLVTGIGSRLDGWANRDLNVGEIIAAAPDLSPFANLLGVSQDDVRTVVRRWGPGKFDAELILDGKAFNPQQVSNGIVTGTNVPGATLIPPAYGLAGVNLHTWTGWGSVTHWNAFVANLEMNGKGTFFDPRLEDAEKFPIAAANDFGNRRSDPDLISPKLPALHFYQLAIPAPIPPPGSFNVAAANRGEDLFKEQGCSTCHVEPTFTEPGWNMHTPAEVCIDDFQAMRSPDERYRTSPLRGLWAHQKGGFFHDGRFPTLLAVVDHYQGCFGLSLSPAEKNDMVEYLKSL